LVVVEALSIVSGAAVSALGASTLIEKPRRGKYVYINAVVRRPAGHLSVYPEYHAELLTRASDLASAPQSDAQQRRTASTTSSSVFRSRKVRY
jgi:hypothetical protein